MPSCPLTGQPAIRTPRFHRTLEECFPRATPRRPPRSLKDVPEEMKAILADIEAKKAKAAGGGGRVSVQVPAGAPPPPPGAPPPPPGPPPDAGMDEAAAARRAQRTETNAMKHRDSAAMDTMLLINEKDEEISKLQQARDIRAPFGPCLAPFCGPR